MKRDTVDHIVSQWENQWPDLDVSPMAILGRISRLSRHLDDLLAANFRSHGIEAWMYDVLASLYRSGEPFELSPSDLVRQSMITTGGMTHRVDGLVERQFVERASGAEDRRRVIVRLTPLGRRLIEAVAPAHYELEETLLAPLETRERRRLVESLRTLLIHLGDVPTTDGEELTPG